VPRRGFGSRSVVLKFVGGKLSAGGWPNLDLKIIYSLTHSLTYLLT